MDCLMPGEERPDPAEIADHTHLLTARLPA